MKPIAGHCRLCGLGPVRGGLCEFCELELAGGRIPLAPTPQEPLRSAELVIVGSNWPRFNYSALTSERRRPGLWTRLSD